MGDITHVVPIVHTLRHHWPETKITWIIGKLEYKLLADLAGVKFIVFDKSNGWREYLKLYRTLRRQRFDCLLLMQVALRANLASLCVRASRRIGYDHARSKDLHGLFVNERIAAGQQEHVLDSFFGFLRQLGLNEHVMDWRLPISTTAREFANRHVPCDKPLLIISPCSSHTRRNWAASYYAEVADYASERYGFQVALCGGPSHEEKTMATAIDEQAKQQLLNLVGKDTLQQFVALLDMAELLISPDSGPAHIAACVGTPVLGLYAASNPRRSGPYNSLRWCVDKYAAASEKYLGKAATEIKWGTKIERPGVMELVTVADVKQKLDEFMQRSEPL